MDNVHINNDYCFYTDSVEGAIYTFGTKDIFLFVQYVNYLCFGLQSH